MKGLTKGLEPTLTRGVHVLVAVGITVALSGCGGDSPTVTTPDDASTPESVAGGEVTITDGDDSYVSGGSLPDGFPEDSVRFPLGFVIGQAQQRDVDGQTAWIVLGTVSNPISPVHADLITAYGEPDSTSGDASYPNDAPVVMTWEDHEGLALTFTLVTNADGDTAVTANIKDLAG